MKKQPIELEKISVKHISDKRLTSKIDKELIQFYSKNRHLILQ